MKKIRGILSVVLISSAPVWAGEGDPYESLAAKLNDKAAAHFNQKVAIVPFTYEDGRESPGVKIVTEKMSQRFADMGRFDVVQQDKVGRVLREMTASPADLLDPARASVLGRRLGVDAIIVGTMKDKSSGHVDVKAQVIHTETAKVVAKASERVPKTWREAARDRKSAEKEKLRTPTYHTEGTWAGIGG